MSTRWRIRALLGGWLGTSLLVVSCGAAFHAAAPESEGGAPSSETAGQGGESSGGVPGGQGDGGRRDAAGGEGELGGGGAGGVPSCEQLGLDELNGHCYVDITDGTATQPAAVAACEALALGRDARLLVLDTTAEQAFILERFLKEYEDASDAWLGLTCSAASHPEIEDCHCVDCSTEELSRKQAAWTWSDGSRASFGWVNGNPNGTVRCAALGYNPSRDIEAWGWVDRACNLDQVTPVPGHTHTYRTICELY